MCEKTVTVETTASAFKFDRASKGLAAQVTCPHCGRQFPHALNKKNADKPPPEPARQPEPAQVITVRTDAPPAAPTPQKAEPVFRPLAAPARPETAPPPPPEPKPAFAPAAPKPPAPFAPLPQPKAKPPAPSRPELHRKTIPSPQTQAILAGGKKKLPEWVQYLLLAGGILVLGVVIFALPFGEADSGPKKADPTPKKKEKDKDKDKPPATQAAPPPPPPGKKLEVAPRPRPAGTPKPGD